MMDLRGTGKSTGCLDHLGPNDAKDMKLVIEWLAQQPWSNGRVGMTGHSYVGSTPIAAAAMRPKGLTTIAPSAGLASMYDHQFQMGVPYLFQWAGPQWSYEALAMSRHLPPGLPTSVPFVGSSPLGTTGDNFGNDVQYFGCGWQNSALTAGSGQVTGQYELWHAKRDWSELAADADIPIFMIHGVNDNAARIPAAEWFFANRFNRPGDKIWLGQHDHGSGGTTRCAPADAVPFGHPNCRFDQWKYALHAWFDKHLAQRDVDTGPPVEVFLNREEPLEVTTDANFDPFGSPRPKVYTASAWERPDIRSELYLDASNMQLSFTPPTAAASKSFTGAANGLLATASAAAVPSSLTFESDPVAEDTLFLGLPRMNLNASVTSEISHLTLQLFREDADGNREAINTCAIQPQLRDGITTISPVVPGQEMELRMKCFTMAHWVPAGQHLEIDVATRTAHHATFGTAGSVTVYTGPGKSHYLLPEVTDFTLFDDVPLKEGA
jgi:predicted acyl esterase